MSSGYELRTSVNTNRPLYSEPYLIGHWMNLGIKLHNRTSDGGPAYRLLLGYQEIRHDNHPPRRLSFIRRYIIPKTHTCH
jgi:hypothetical protein